jgi:hypothetical protein
MPKYTVTLYETIETDWQATVIVEAENEDDAQEKAMDIADDQSLWRETNMNSYQDHDVVELEPETAGSEA